MLPVMPLCLSVCAAALMCGGCAQSGKENETPGSGEKLSVVTTIFPQYDFVREIAGEQVNLKMLLKPGEETHSYEPTPQDIIAIQECDVFIYVGGENDEWVEEILESMPDEGRKTLKLVDCVDTYEEEHVEGMKEERGRSHEEEEDTVHNETDDMAAEDTIRSEDDGKAETEELSVHQIDEHVWTSPQNAIQIVEAITGLLSQEDEANREVYEANAKAYVEKLRELDEEFAEVVQGSQRNLLIFGDRFPFRYFAEAYGLDYYAAFPGCASDTEPSAATMAFLINQVKEEEVPVILKMELSNEDIAGAVAEATGTEVRTFYSCHNLSADEFENGETYLSLMEKNVETLREALN